MPKNHKTANQVHHPLSAQDAITVAAMRAQTAPFKGATFGPAGRQAYDEIMNAVPAPEGVSFHAANVGGVPGYWCTPPHPAAETAVLFLHGGGYTMGSAQAYLYFAGHFALRLQAAVFVADYRLAPEHPFPAALEDADAAYLGLLHGGAKKIVVVGDSAGGGLSLSLLSLLQSDAAHPAIKPVAAVLMSPWTDLSMSGASIAGKAGDELYLTQEMLQACATMYLGATTASHPQASVLHAELQGLPPLQIHVGTAEILLDDAVRYAHRAQDAKVDTTLHIWEGMPHVFPNCPGILQAADQALAIMATFVADRLKTA